MWTTSHRVSCENRVITSPQHVTLPFTQQRLIVIFRARWMSDPFTCLHKTVT
ncbi:hypothetical protein DPMN_020864 [Dreissena polymorpha]|uniref:Uncharacterized protein n=1 Tax=Dreissena polymorpha TaxID=45954 RepID=A0A9D4S9F9_DREPO|nr:hypothetical protein DPMN_020864 [Dreissena polymorpha]